VDEFDDKSETLPVKIALSMLQFYKTGISPLMQPSCRFQPTCSSYAVDAYTRYGVTKGTIMTAWRLFRCTPWGDRGYDPAVWPPKGLQFLENI
jgi:putative membrane protein insertion efficiency factor